MNGAYAVLTHEISQVADDRNAFQSQRPGERRRWEKAGRQRLLKRMLANTLDFSNPPSFRDMFLSRSENSFFFLFFKVKKSSYQRLTTKLLWEV